MPRKTVTPDFLKGASATSDRMSARDADVSARRTVERGELSSLPIDRIKPRASDTRKLNKRHVYGLSESIAILGLIEPLVVDKDGVILAGGHRLAAIYVLRDEKEQAFHSHFPDGNIPVRVMPFIAAEEPERALQIEVAENEHRRDYTPAEVRNLAQYLRESGYRDSGGRPRKGEKPLMPALSVVIGKNKRTIRRYLNEYNKPKTGTDVRVYLQRAKKSLEKWQSEVPSKAIPTEFSERLPEILELLEAALSGGSEK